MLCEYYLGLLNLDETLRRSYKPQTISEILSDTGYEGHAQGTRDNQK